jgi:predicted MPP superfamily phosphohydrolase
LDAFSSVEGFKLLLCHHPEYYPRYIRERDIDLTLSGHAHGGQWQIVGRGIFAPGQGLFPRYTGGVYEGRLVVSRGLTNTVSVPRFGNPTELVRIHLLPTA